MTDLERFRQTVEDHLERAKISPTRFGRTVLRDPLFVFELRKGREPRESTREKVMEALKGGEAA